MTDSHGVRTMNDSNDYLYCCFWFRSLNNHEHETSSPCSLSFSLSLSPTFTLLHTHASRRSLFLYVQYRRFIMWRNVMLWNLSYNSYNNAYMLYCYSDKQENMKTNKRVQVLRTTYNIMCGTIGTFLCIHRALIRTFSLMTCNMSYYAVERRAIFSLGISDHSIQILYSSLEMCGRKFKLMC